MTTRPDTAHKRVVGVTVTRLIDGLSPSSYPKAYRIENEAAQLAALEDNYLKDINAFLDSVEARELNLSINRTNLIISV